MKLNTRIMAIVVGIVVVIALTAGLVVTRGSTKTVAVPGPTVFVTPTPTVTAAASPEPQRDVATQSATFVADTVDKGSPQAYALAFADSGAVNLHREPAV